jgi:hypothetical protein
MPEISLCSQSGHWSPPALCNCELIDWHFPGAEGIADSHSLWNMNIERDCLSLGPPEGCRQDIQSSILQSVHELKSSRSATNKQTNRDLDSGINAGAILLTSARAEGGRDMSQLWLKSPRTTFFMTSRETEGRSRFRGLVSPLHPLRHILKLPKRPSHTTITTGNCNNSRKMLLVAIMAGTPSTQWWPKSNAIKYASGKS